MILISRLNSFIKLASILIIFTKSVMPKRLTKMLTSIMHKRLHYLDKLILYHIDIRDITLT
jgi:hypothetical protein